MENILFQQAEEYHFRFQKGLYLSGRSDVTGATILYSDTVEDYFWNYATKIHAKRDNIAAFVDEVKKFLSEKGRVPCFYLTPWTEPRQELEAYLQKMQYTVQFRDAWMFFDPTMAEARENLTYSLSKELSIDVAEDPSEFLEVFSKAYGGESTEDEPYGGLPTYYLDALKQSFGLSRDVDTFHFVAHTKNGQAIAIGTLVYKDKWGCIYNVGTPSENRGKGFGTAISYACIDKWRMLEGQILFLQTEVGSKVEKWYSKMGFVTRFVGEGWAISK